MARTCVKVFQPYPPRGGSRARQKKRSWGGVPFLKKNFFFRPELRRLQQPTKCIAMIYSISMWDEVLLFFIPKFFSRSLFSGEQQWPFGPLVSTVVVYETR